MKSVLISIQPKWCELIGSGEKTLEVRKTCPKLETPFKCYIYCTKDVKHRLDDGKRRIDGNVIGEFICNEVSVFLYDEHISYPTPKYDGDPSIYDCGEGYWITCGELEKTCLSHDELMKYGNKKDLYGWHISALAIYDKPKPLSSFTKPYGTIVKAFDSPYIQRPPQSWCYVEELKDNG